MKARTPEPTHFNRFQPVDSWGFLGQMSNNQNPGDLRLPCLGSPRIRVRTDDPSSSHTLLSFSKLSNPFRLVMAFFPDIWMINVIFFSAGPSIYTQRKWTYPLKMHHFNRKIVFQPIFFQGTTVSFRGCKTLSTLREVQQASDFTHNLSLFFLRNRAVERYGLRLNRLIPHVFGLFWKMHFSVRLQWGKNWSTIRECCNLSGIQKLRLLNDMTGWLMAFWCLDLRICWLWFCQFAYSNQDWN